MLNEIINACQYLLYNEPEAQETLEYLNNRLNFKSQEKFKFGYFPSIKNISLLSSIVGEKCLIDNKLLFQKEINDSSGYLNSFISYFENYPLIMPYYDVYGNPIALVARTLFNEDQRRELKLSKYKNTVFKKRNHLFGLNFAKKEILKEDSVYICEGQFDVIKANEFGFNNCVALGNSNMTIEQFLLVTRYTNNIFMLLDNDEAGDKGYQRAFDKFGKHCNIQRCKVPNEYHDLDEYISSIQSKDDFNLQICNQ